LVTGKLMTGIRDFLEQEFLIQKVCILDLV